MHAFNLDAGGELICSTCSLYGNKTGKEYQSLSGLHRLQGCKEVLRMLAYKASSVVLVVSACKHY